MQDSCENLLASNPETLNFANRHSGTFLILLIESELRIVRIKLSSYLLSQSSHWCL